MVDHLDMRLEEGEHGEDMAQVEATVAGEVEVGHGAGGVATDLGCHGLLGQIVLA